MRRARAGTVGLVATVGIVAGHWGGVDAVVGDFPTFHTNDGPVATAGQGGMDAAQRGALRARGLDGLQVPQLHRCFRTQRCS